MDVQQAEKFADRFFEQLMLQMRQVRRTPALLKDLPPPSQASLLTTLEMTGPMRVADIAERLHITSPGASSLVNELVKAGWASRTEHPEDRRIKVVALTPTGREVANRFNASRRAMLVKILQHFEPEETESLLASFAKVIRVVNQELESL